MNILNFKWLWRKPLLEGTWRLVGLLSICTLGIWILITRGVFNKYSLEFQGAETPLALKQMLKNLNKYLTTRSASPRYAPCIGDRLHFEGSKDDVNRKRLKKKLEKAPEAGNPTATEQGQIFWQATVLSAPCA